MKRKTKTVRISKPLHSLVKMHVRTTGMRFEGYVEKTLEKDLAAHGLTLSDKHAGLPNKTGN